MPVKMSDEMLNTVAPGGAASPSCGSSNVIRARRDVTLEDCVEVALEIQALDEYRTPLTTSRRQSGATTRLPTHRHYQP